MPFDRTVRASVIHLSDTHFSEGPRGAVASSLALEAVLRSEALRPRPTCAVITGDIADTGTVGEYVKARAVLSRFSVPVHLVPGNHDDALTMARQLSSSGYVREAEREPGRCYYAVDYDEFRLVCCDSSRVGSHAGELGDIQLAWIEEQLVMAGDRPVFLAMHHHPFFSGIEAMDCLRLLDLEALESVLWRHRNVHRLLTGHLHRQVVTTVGGVQVVGANSTGRQVLLGLAPGAPGAYIDEPASVVWHILLSDGNVVSHFLPVPDAGLEYDPF